MTYKNHMINVSYDCINFIITKLNISCKVIPCKYKIIYLCKIISLKISFCSLYLMFMWKERVNTCHFSSFGVIILYKAALLSLICNQLSFFFYIMSWLRFPDWQIKMQDTSVNLNSTFIINPFQLNITAFCSIFISMKFILTAVFCTLIGNPIPVLFKRIFIYLSSPNHTLLITA